MKPDQRHAKLPKITVFNGQNATITINTTTFINTGIMPIQQANGQVLFQPNNIAYSGWGLRLL